MFAAVRERFRFWGARFAALAVRRRTRRLAGLFAFEFVVVLLGVLAAQMLENHFAGRRAAADARGAIERARGETENARGMAAYWLALEPCLQPRLQRIMRAAADGTAIPPVYFERPRMPFTPVSKWTEATTLAARRAYGDELVGDYSDISDMSQHMAAATRELSGDWSILRLADPALGTPSAADRSNARLAAARIEARLDALVSTANYLIATADRRGIHSSSRVIQLPTGCRPVRP